ncbi:LysR family transcriptional regulator [Granulicella sp. L60]|uniref:LysR family transcriptional regulator n=1 Tax=Granulicella sp. L60 TaxID=1641866 RepID=UPI00131DB70C|nr:LysR family transcriptional regulator [Granulicella sp. L60]
MANGYTTNTLEAFVATVRFGSFSAVARNRGMTTSSIARQVTALEHEIGVSLFIRTTRSLELTEAGRVLFLRSETILRDLADAKSEAASLHQDVRGLVRVSCLPAFGKKHIVPHLPDLFQRYPKLRISVDVTERLNNPQRQNTDLTLRVGELTHSTLLSKQFATQRRVFAASPQYLARYGVPHSIEDCAKHRLIDRRHLASGKGWRELLGEGREVSQNYLLQIDDFGSQVDACVLGLGIIRIPDWAIYDRVLTLLPISSEHFNRVEGIYLLRNRGPMTAAIKAFCNHLEQKIGSPPIWERTLAQFASAYDAGSS